MIPRPTRKPGAAFVATSPHPTAKYGRGAWTPTTSLVRTGKGQERPPERSDGASDRRIGLNGTGTKDEDPVEGALVWQSPPQPAAPTVNLL